MALAIVVAIGLFLGPAVADPRDSESGAEWAAPVLQPGWRKPGTLHVYGPTVNSTNPVATKTIDGPFGPITVTARFIGGSDGMSVLSGGSGTCVSEFWQPSFRFTTYTPWRWDYGAVTWIGTTSYSQWALPLFYWDNVQTWNDWAPGWQYAWGNGRATLKYGVRPVGASLASVHTNALVDAWGNCTPTADQVVLTP